MLPGAWDVGNPCVLNRARVGLLLPLDRHKELMPTVVPCPARDRYHFQGVQFPLQGHGYHEPYLALCRYLGKIILLAFGWRILSLFMRAWVRLYPLTSTCCLVEEQKHPVTALCAVSTKVHPQQDKKPLSCGWRMVSNGWASWWVNWMSG